MLSPTPIRVHFTRRFLSLFLYVSVIAQINGLYEDQIGKFDWKQQYIGKVKFIYADVSIAGTHKFVVGTEQNVIACLSTRTGSIIWRQVMEKGSAGQIDTMSDEGDLITVSGEGRHIRNWDPNTGVLQWETSFPQLLKSDGTLHFKVDSQKKEIIKIEVIPKVSVKVSIYSLMKSSLKTSDAIAIPWLDFDTECKFISSDFFICVDYNKRCLQLLSVRDAGEFTPVSLSSRGIEMPDEVHIKPLPFQEAFDKPFFALDLSQSIAVLQMQSNLGFYAKGQQVSPKVALASINNTIVVFSITKTDKRYNINAVDLEANKIIEHLSGSFELPEGRGAIADFYVFPYTKKDHDISYKSLFLYEDHSILLIHQQGRVIWSREEALSSIVSAEIMDLPLSETDASIEQEFGQPDAGIASMFLTRLRSQMFMLETALLNVITGFKGDSGMGGDRQITLMRDNFGLHKIIIVVTRPGKIFGIDNFSGLILWSHYEPYLSPFVKSDKPHLPLYVQRTTAHYPYPPVCTALGKHSKSGKSVLYSFDPISGKTIESKILDYEVLQVMQAGFTNKNYLRNIIILDTSLKAYVYPDVMVSPYKEKHYVFIANAGVLTGYSLAHGGKDHLKTTEVWKVKFPQSIIEISTKKPLEHVHSQGRVMGDRSVLYKYINPNLAAVFTEGIESAYKTFCNIYLVDTITGLIVYSASHKRCRKPLNVVHSENWVVYSYYNDKSRRVEISSIELFEGLNQSNTTAFSSFAPPSLPLVEHQTFIFPSTIEIMSDTVTERGMTSKHILISLPSGGILELPKNFLDPRRPITPLPEHREEGLIPYIPELPIMAEGIINYNQTVMNVQGIETAASGLESTCLVFIYGLDLFYTRVTPSKTFDILKDDFDHYLISVVLLGLLILSYTTKRLAARKTLRAAWK